MEDPSKYEVSSSLKFDDSRAHDKTSPLSVANVLSERARHHPARELFCFGSFRMSYGHFESWTLAIAQDLIRRGVRPGDRVLVQLPNRLEALALQVAALRAGAVDVPVVPIYRTHEMRQILADARPKVVCTVDKLGDRHFAEEMDLMFDELAIEPAVRFLVDGQRPGWGPILDWNGDHPAGPDLPSPQHPDEPVLLLYTSGTTSAPKGALLSGRAVMTQLANMQIAFVANEDTVTLAGTPVSHVAGFLAAVMFPAFVGGRSAIMPAWNADAAVELIDREGANLMLGASVFITDLISRYETLPPSVRRLTHYAASGSALSPNVVDRAAAQGVIVVRAYGMTETAGACALTSALDPLHRRREWDGRMVGGSEMQAVDVDREPVPWGEVGEIRVRGTQMFNGYTVDELTRAQVDGTGWFYTGDLGRVDAEGWVQVVGRIKDIVNRGGEKFSTADIEQAIAAHPGVAAAAVKGVPDERFGEVVGAWVVAEQSWPEDLTAQSILTHLVRLGLAKQKHPVEWHVVDTLPRTASGKLQKHRLDELHDLATWKTGPRAVVSGPSV